MRTEVSEQGNAIAVDDFDAERAFAALAMAVCERLLDHPTDPDALAAARQLIDDHPQRMLRGRLLIAALPDY